MSAVKLPSAYSTTARRVSHFLLTDDEVTAIVTEWVRAQTGEAALVDVRFDKMFDGSRAEATIRVEEPIN